MIKLTNINKYYNKGKSNEIHVLNNISIDLPEKSLVTILGKSGSGKSTLLNVIGSLDKATGTINYNNELEFDKYNSTKVDSYRNNKIGYIFQNYHLLPELTVFENLAYSLELIGITDKEEVTKRIDKALELVNMKSYKRRNSLALSGGQQQRVAIARALVKGAKILIADEPTGNLDSKNTIDVMNILKSISATCLVLLITHDNDIANMYSDRIISMQDGKIIDDKNFTTNNSLKTLSNGIYLSELNHSKTNLDNINLNIYSDSKENMDLNIYVKDGIVYLDVKTELQTKVLGVNSEIEIKQDKPKDEEVEPIDLSVFTNNTHFQNNYFKYFVTRLVNAFKYFFVTTKKQKLIYSVFILIGIIISYNSAVLTSNLKIDDDQILSSSNYEAVALNNYETMDDFLTEEYADTFVAPNYISFSYYDIQLPITYNNHVDARKSGIQFTSNKHYSNIDYTINDKEVVLSKYAANKIIELVSAYIPFNQSDLIGYNILIFDEYYEVSRVDDEIENNSFIFNFRDYSKFTLTSIPEFDNNFSNIKDNIDYYSSKAESSYSYYTDEHWNLNVVEGRKPHGYKEVMIPSVFKGTLYENKLLYSVVGYYELKEDMYPLNVCSATTFEMQYSNFYGELSSVYTNDMDKILELTKNSVYFKDDVLTNQFQYNLDNNQPAIITVCVMLGIIIVIIFFTSRAKMLTKIKVIGIYRSLGSSKIKIYLSFMAETIILTTFTTMIGYIGIYIGVIAISN